MDHIINVREIMAKFAASALGGKKIPHGVSNPVFRKDESGAYQVCAFIYQYNAVELRNKSIRRPLRWMSMNLSDGEITEYQCSDKDFSATPEDVMCDLRPEEDTVFSKEYRKQTLAIFDLILKKLLITKCFDQELNDTYMYMMLRMVSIGFKQYYKDLGQI